MPPLKPIFPSAHPSGGDSLKQKLLSSNSLLELINQVHEEEMWQLQNQQWPLATLLGTISVSLTDSLGSSSKSYFPLQHRSKEGPV